MDDTTRSPRACAWDVTYGPGRKPGASSCTRKRLSLMTSAAYDILISCTETIGAFNSGFGSVNPHRPTMVHPSSTAKARKAVATDPTE